MEIAANERGKSGEIKEKSGERERESRTRANPVYLARNFQSQLSQEKGPRAMKSCSAQVVPIWRNLNCRAGSPCWPFDLLLSPSLSSCDSFLQPGHRFRNSNERPLRILITLISREPVRTAFVTSDHSHPCALSFGRRDSPLCLSIPFLFLPSSVDRSSIVKSNHATIRLYRDKNRYSFPPR